MLGQSGEDCERSPVHAELYYQFHFLETPMTSTDAIWSAKDRELLGFLWILSPSLRPAVSCVNGPFPWTTNLRSTARRVVRFPIERVERVLLDP